MCTLAYRPVWWLRLCGCTCEALSIIVIFYILRLSYMYTSGGQLADVCGVRLVIGQPCLCKHDDINIIFVYI